MAGGVTLALKNYDEVVKGIETKEKNLAKAVNSMASDFKSRAPGWIGQEVTEVYTIKKKDITAAKTGVRQSGTIKIANVSIKNYEIKYSGRVLTPIHFKMTPKNRPQRRNYRVAVEIKKGQKKNLPEGVFLALGNGSSQLPFQRDGAERLPIHPIKTLSIPQMITGDDVSGPLQDRINQELDKRLQHHIERYNKK